MIYTPKILKRTLKKCINEICEHPETFAQNPGKGFTRSRKLPFKQVLKSVLSMTGKSLRGELMEHFNLNPSMPTISAFVQQRNKVDYRAFENLFHTFTNAIDEQGLFKGYRLLSVDGSDLHTPTNKDEKGQKFVIRARDLNKHGLTFGMTVPQQDEFDISVCFGLTRQQTKPNRLRIVI